jgi:hypothetical protein
MAVANWVYYVFTKPFEIDYFETFFTLIDVMAEAYYKLLTGTEGPICTQAFFELVLKCDARFKVTNKNKSNNINKLTNNI